MKIEQTTVMVPFGGFSTSVVADHRFVYPIPPGLPSEHAAVLMCAGLTVYSALKRHVTRPGLQVGILGVGGLGHLAIQFAKAFGCHVTALSSSPGKKPQAMAFGADSFLLSTDKSVMRAAVYSYDLIICTTNAGIQWGSIFNVLKKRGQLILLGFPDLEFNSTDLVAHELSITGSLIGTPSLMREMLAFARQHAITPMVELMPMAQVNEAILRVKENKARYRFVLVN